MACPACNAGPTNILIIPYKGDEAEFATKAALATDKPATVSMFFGVFLSAGLPLNESVSVLAFAVGPVAAFVLWK